MKTSKDTVVSINENKKIKNFKLYSKNGFKILTSIYMKICTENRIMYNSNWLGMKIIQLPNDMISMQECIWNYKPDLIIETGVALGGSLIFYASIMNNYTKDFNIIGVDVEIYPENKKKIQDHFLSKNITLIEKSSVDKDTIVDIDNLIKKFKSKKILISLDSNHEFSHVNKELQLYKKFIKKNGYLIVQDGAMDDISDIPSAKPNWKLRGPKDSIKLFLKNNTDFSIDESYSKFGITASPNGFLRKV